MAKPSETEAEYLRLATIKGERAELEDWRRERAAFNAGCRPGNYPSPEEEAEAERRRSSPDGS